MARRLLLGLLLSVGACRPAPEATAAEPPPVPNPAIAIHGIEREPELGSAIREGVFFRWVLPRHPELRVGFATAGTGPSGEIEVEVARLPLDAALANTVPGLPVRFEPEAFEVAGQRYALPSHTLTLRLSAPGTARWLVIGRERKALAGAVDDLLFQLTATGRRGAGPASDFRVHETPWLDRRGNFTVAPGGEGFVVDSASDRDRIGERAAALAAALPIRSGAVVLLAAPGDVRRAALTALAVELDRAVGEMASRLPYAGDRTMTLAIEPDFAAMARATGAMGEAVAGGRSDLSMVFDPDDLDAYRFALAGRLLDRSGWAQKLPPALADGAALWLSKSWHGRPAEDWLPSFARAGAFPDAAELLAVERTPTGSPLLATPVAAVWIGRRTGATLAEKLAAPLPGTAALEADLAALAKAANQGTAAKPPPVGRAAGAAPAFLRGVSFAMLNSIDGGYHAPSVDRELDRLAALGADAVSLMPFASQSDPRAPDLVMLDDHPSSETDVGLLHAARRAHAHGFAVLWKPHLWISHDSWPGEVEMKSEALWARWFAGYRRYLLHHAFLAARAKAELLCVGVELDRTTIGPAREADWRRLIAAVRELYPGLLTYAANWDRAPEVPFWSALDYVAVDAYYPLAAGEGATDAELRVGAAQVVGQLAALAARADRPLLLTEVGFAAQAAAWRAPHTEGGRFDEVAQERAYRALFGALGRPPWLAGLFVWKSFSDEVAAGGRGGDGEADFRFLGRRAERAVRDYFHFKPKGHRP